MPGALAPGNWSGRVANLNWTASSAIATGTDQVAIVMALGAPNAGPDLVSYTATPPDVLGTPDLAPAPAFADFPIA